MIYDVFLCNPSGLQAVNEFFYYNFFKISLSAEYVQHFNNFEYFEQLRNSI